MCAGESFKKAIRSGRLKASDFKRPVGQTKKQSVLVPLAESADIEESFSDMCYVLVTTLVTVAKGRGSGGSNNYGFYPFGKLAAESIERFKAIPSTWFGIVIAAMYPFVQKD